MVNLCGALSTTIQGICAGSNANSTVCDKTNLGLTVVCSGSNGSADTIANADADALASDLASGNTILVIQDICNTMQLDIANNCDNFNDPDVQFCDMLVIAVGDTCQQALSTNSNNSPFRL